jgi:hypothetical protein
VIQIKFRVTRLVFCVKKLQVLHFLHVNVLGGVGLSREPTEVSL